MTYPEALARVVGMLTVAHEARRDPDRSAEELGALYGTLLADLGTFEGQDFSLSFSTGDPPEVIQATVQRATHDALERVITTAREELARIAAAFVYAFNELAAEYEAACPDADVPGLLRRLGIESAGDAD